MSKQDAILLVGCLAGRNKLNLAHYQMLLPSDLSDCANRFSERNKGRNELSRAIQKAFKFLTGYETFEEAYKNEREDRWMTDSGMGEDLEKKFVVSFNANMLDEAQLDALGGGISDAEI
jgi:hypothetical protein